MIGILLINLGSPDAPTPKAVRRYLREFLLDPLVIDINPVARWVLVNCIIAPFRSFKSAKAYASIWTEQGSPLVVYTQELTDKVRSQLGSDFKVEFGMRYGQPAIARAVRNLMAQNVSEIRVLPLYPHYALSSTQSSIDEVNRVIADLNISVPVKILNGFYEHKGFIDAFCEQGKTVLEKDSFDHILFSFHGLPERHITKLDASSQHCLVKDGCCDKVGDVNNKCYRAQCFRTAHLIAEGLNLDPKSYSISFQSRLGRDPWIKPFTDVRLKELAEAGHKNIAVFCPAFVADCLETLEEIQIRECEAFKSYGGTNLQLIPSLNASSSWVDAVCQMVR